MPNNTSDTLSPHITVHERRSGIITLEVNPLKTRPHVNVLIGALHAATAASEVGFEDHSRHRFHWVREEYPEAIIEAVFRYMLEPEPGLLKIKRTMKPRTWKITDPEKLAAARARAAHAREVRQRSLIERDFRELGLLD